MGTMMIAVSGWVCDIEVESGGPAILPIVLEVAIEVATAEGNDSVGPTNCPEHARLLEAGTDYGFASRFDDARADKQVLAAKLGVAHAFGISLKVACLDANLLDYLRIDYIDGAQREDQLFDFSLVQQPLMFLHPSFLLHGVVGVQLARQLPQVLAGVIEIDNLNRTGEMQKSPITTFFTARLEPR
jgi:hypothetical protein